MESNATQPQPSPADSPIQDGPIWDNPINNPSNDLPDNETLSPTNGGKPARPKGPNAFAVVLGLLAMSVAGVIIGSETMGLKVDWSRLGPGAIVVIGVLFVALGALGLIRRHDDA